jgi:hypothetical protein
MIGATGGSHAAKSALGDATAVLDEARRIRMAAHLRVFGRADVFTLRDFFDLPENKRAVYMLRQIEVAEKSIRAVLTGRPKLTPYLSQTANPLIPLALGGRTGASLVTALGVVPRVG